MVQGIIARKGCFEQASGDSLFLDEIGDMSSGLQAKLLRVLETGIVTGRVVRDSSGRWAVYRLGRPSK